MKAFLQFGEWGGPYHKVAADTVLQDMSAPHSNSTTGYGPKIPNTYSVLYGGRWHHVVVDLYPEEDVK